MALGEQALAEGRLDEAQDRFERALVADPESVPARAGLGRVALARGELSNAGRWLEEAVERAPDDYSALLALADVRAAEGDVAEAGRLLDRARRAAPGRPEAHARLAALTGPAPEPAADADPDERLRRAGAHPYDPAATLAAARVWVERGDPEAAARWLRGSWWLADLDPEAGAAAIALLREIDPAWRERRVVPVHCLADEDVRADPWWTMRLRLLWANLSRSLHPVLETVFVPVSMGAFSSAGTDASLEAIGAAAAGAAPLPGSGLVAVFTERRPAAQRTAFALGQAEFLGRTLVVRLEPGPSTESQTLIHEVLHLYGAVHVSPDVDSLMNPSGDSLALDVPNTRIVHDLRDRRFESGDPEVDVLPHVDAPALIAAYREALALNLEARRSGVTQALAEAEESRVLAARRARAAVALDDHLADVADFLAALEWREGHRAEAVRLLDLASQLYGPTTPRGSRARARADAILDASTSP